MASHRKRAQACDACHQQKAKCNWRYPKCLDCVRLDRDCTFARLPPASVKMRGMVVDTVRSSPDDVQGEIADRSDTGHNRIRGDEPRSAPVHGASRTHPGPNESDDASNIHTSGPSIDPETEDAAELSAVLEQYFKELNNSFPIFSKHFFLDDPSGYLNRLKNQTLVRAMLDAMRACSTQRRNAPLPSNALESHLQSGHYVRQALSVVGQLTIEPASLAKTQLLLTIVVAVQETQHSDDIAADILAIATRKAQALGLHKLDEMTGISYEDRLEKIRLFWCLYILDKDTMMRSHIPPLINDDDVRVLEPKLISDDRCGLITPIDGHESMNVFTARQRLARIESSIWSIMMTFKATHQPLSQRWDAVSYLNNALTEWKAEWLRYGDLSVVSNAWSSDARIEIVSLQFKYFRCIVRANPGTPYNFDTIREFAERMKGSEEHGLILPPTVVATARDTLQLAGSMRKAGFRYLCDSLQYVVPAIVILLIEIVAGIDKSTKVADRLVAGAWLELFGYVVETTKDDDFRSILNTCRCMMEVASASIDAT